MSGPTCRACGAQLETTFADLGSTPLANSYLTAEQLARPEPRYPLHARVCDRCLLVQVEAAVAPEEIFSDYAYFSSYSESWVAHARHFAEGARALLDLGPSSSVVEVASNDGYLLQHFVAAGVPVLGVEPAANVAEAARARGVPTETGFFGAGTAEALDLQADLLVANNVLAHVPDLNDFVDGIRIALKPQGVVSIEVPHLLRLIEGTQFDTIYHEHFSYFSVLAARHALAGRGIVVFDVEPLPTHGGSVRIWGCRAEADREPTERMEAVLEQERAAGLDRLDTYERFPERVEERRRDVVEFFADARDAGLKVAGYGAAAKGNTFLNFCGLTSVDVPFVCDLSPHKQGLFLPGSHIPVLPPDALDDAQPDRIVLLAWNLADEIVAQLARVRKWGARFVTTMPAVRDLG
ncbi:MAG TPA: class I SAM-dependent methyltransferase [Acidimicrobiales bacterium]|nr:class I SAM-dependent methyltransferase [Acidimicrobiales bacterium]